MKAKKNIVDLIWWASNREPFSSQAGAYPSFDLNIYDFFKLSKPIIQSKDRVCTWANLF